MNVAIFGARGQDGKILHTQLEKEGHTVFPIQREGPVDVLKNSQVQDFFSQVEPDQVYYLAASHRSSEGKVPDPHREWQDAYKIHLEGWLNVLEASRRTKKTTKLLYASSAHIFGEPQEFPQKETTPFQPTCAYGSSKCFGMEAGKYYRREHGLFVSHAILFPHESIHRSASFLSRKLLEAALESKKNPAYECPIGDLSATADWGYAPEYTQAMQKILRLPQPDDFIVATGTEHSVADFAHALFEPLGLDWRNHLKPKGELLTKPKRRYWGQATKLKEATGHQCLLTLPNLGRKLLEDYRMTQ